MKGSLQDMAVVDLIQHHCLDRKTVSVHLRNGRQKADLFFKNGNVVHAIMENQEGEEVVYQVMHWEKGTFEDRPDVDAPTISITRGWTGLLLEGARRFDEAAGEGDGTAGPETAEGQAHSGSRGLFSSILPSLGEQRERTGQVSVEIAPQVSRAWAEEGGIGAASQKEEEVLALISDMGAQIDGFYGAAVADLQGNILINALGEVANVDSMVNTASQYVKTVGDAAAKLGQGGLEDNLLTTGTAYLLTKFIAAKTNYLLVMADRKAVNLGSMRHACRVCVGRLAELGLDRIVWEGKS